MKYKKAKNIINKNKKDWNKIAKKFSNTRKFLWPELKNLNQYVKKGDKVLDLGCGNGRLFQAFNKDINYTGVDLSKELINIAKQKYDSENIKFITTNALNLPFEKDYFDIVFSIAMLHHIPSKNLRNKFLKQVKKVLKPDSLFIVSVWDLWRLKIFIRYKIWPMIFGWHPKGLDWKDVYIPFKTKNGKVKRYYHCFTQNELIKLLKKHKFSIKKSYKTKKGNIFLICKNLL